MRAIVLLCLLHAAFGQYNWNGPSPITPLPTQPDSSVCLLDQASCGCCLMQKQIGRMEWFFNLTVEEMNKELTKSKMALNKIRASHSAFSVALNNENLMKCYGPYSTDQIIVYKNIFLNLGDSYNVNTGVFTAPRTGVYSLALTIYSDGGIFGSTLAACANLQVNGQTVSSLLEQYSLDLEDSATTVMAIKLWAGDKVTASMPKGCFICDSKSHYNTFTGFLLYATD